MGADSRERLEEMKGAKSIRIISSDTDGFAATGRNTTRGHAGRIAIQCLLRKKRAPWERMIYPSPNPGVDHHPDSTSAVRFHLALFLYNVLRFSAQ